VVSIEGPDGGVDITGATPVVFSLVLLCLKKSLLFLT
jgi:hypothetical protein